MYNFTDKIKTDKLRKCQREAYEAIVQHYSKDDAERCTLVQLPTGTGKSALIAVAPFGIAHKKVLILTPNVKLARQIELELDITKPDNIYNRLDLLDESVSFYSLRFDETINKDDIQEQDILITNYHQLQDLEKWFGTEKDAVDLIIIDETHHQEANTYQTIINFFDKAKIIGLTATPFRSDGKKIEGKVIYKYHFHQAIKDEVIRNMKIVDVSPQGVRLSFTDDGSKVYNFEQILQMKEKAWFNQGIALSEDCCNSIAQKAKEKLEDLKTDFPDTQHQIIAVAISKRHAREIVKPAFERLGLKVGMVSSDLQDKNKNDKTFDDLKYSRIDVIVHIGMLGEGFDHPPLGVAAIFRPYKTLNPYIQFLGRVIRRNEDTKHCFVVSHIGLNQITRFQEFKMFDYEEQRFFEKLFTASTTTEDSFVEDVDSKRDQETLNEDQEQLSIQEVGSETVDVESEFVSLDALVEQVQSLSTEQQDELLKRLGIGDATVKIKPKQERVKPVDKRKALRNLLNEKEISITTDIVKRLELKMYDRNFNPRFRNFEWVKRKVSREVNLKLGIDTKQRKNINNEQFREMEGRGVLKDVEQECLEYFREKLNNK